MTSSGVIPTQRTEPDMDAWALVTAAQVGDREAFGQLYERYVDVVFRYVLCRVGERALAEDLTAQTFLNALRRISSVSYQGRDIGSWFVTIARNLVLDHVKCSRTRLEVTTAQLLGGDAGDLGPEREAVDAETARTVRQCVAQLPALERECVVLRHLVGLSVAEIAAAVGCSKEAAKGRTHRGVRALATMPQLATLMRG